MSTDRPPDPGPPRRRVMACPHCDEDFEFTDADLSFAGTVKKSVRAAGGTVVYVVCPHCGKKAEVAS